MDPRVREDRVIVAGYLTRSGAMAHVFSIDTLRKHLANACAHCHSKECWVCDRARALDT